MKFRGDINGLRAIAVMAVLIFHFNESWLPGGFIGVDIFFVISGFLMTKIIVSKLERQSLNLAEFYSARMNRIFPALFALCFTMLIFGWFYLIPFEYKALTKHVAASTGFISNYIYMSESGYFDATSLDKWLLHTWSLSVEWLFYVFYPVLLLVIVKLFPKSNLKKPVIILWLMSVIYCLYLTQHYPDKTYFDFLGRSWQLLSGALVYVFFNKKDTTNQAEKCMEFIGIILILFSLLYFDSSSIWPNIYTILPIIGVCLILISANNESKITGNIVMQRLGDYSYSIYLWHWPIVVLMYKLEIFSTTNKLLGIGLSIILGYLSYKYIEAINFKRQKSFKEYYKNPLIHILAIISLSSSAIWFFDGLGFPRLPLNVNTLSDSIQSSPFREKCHFNGNKPLAVRDSCEYLGERIEWAVIGDSHAVELTYALAKELEKDNIGVKHFSYSACIPSYMGSAGHSNCVAWYNNVVNYLKESKNIRNVVIIHRYSLGVSADFSENDKQSQAVLSSLSTLINELASHKSKIYIYQPVPDLPNTVSNIITKNYLLGKEIDKIPSRLKVEYDKKNQQTINFFKMSSFPSNVEVLDSKTVFCDPSKCYATKNGKALYLDDNHPSIFSAEKLVKLITK